MSPFLPKGPFESLSLSVCLFTHLCVLIDLCFFRLSVPQIPVCQKALKDVRRRHTAPAAPATVAVFFHKRCHSEGNPPPPNPTPADPHLLPAVVSLLVGRAVLQRCDGGEAQSCCIVGRGEAGNSVQEDEDQQAEFEPAVTQSAGCRGTEGGTVLARRMSSFQRPTGTVVHFQVPPHVTALCVRVHARWIVLQQPWGLFA